MKHRRPLARHAQHNSPSIAKQITVFILTSLLVLSVSATAVIAIVVWDGYNRFAENSVDLVDLPSLPSQVERKELPPVAAFKAYPGEVNFLLTGTDECEETFSHLFGGRCDGGANGARNDVTLLIHIPEDHSQAYVISFPRDLMLETPSCATDEGRIIPGGSYQQFNSTFDRGGLPCVVRTVEETSGFHIPFAAKISWGGVITITDELGGVDVCVANGIHDRHTGLALAPGVHNVKGLEALQFLRTRYGLSNGSDLARISNQQLYMSALLKKITSDGVLNDVFQMASLANVIIDNVQHSSSLNDPKTLVSLALLLKEIPLEKISFVQYPTVTDPNNPNRVVASNEASVFWETLHTNGLIGVENDRAGAIIDTPDSQVSTEDQNSITPSIVTPGMTASANACANGAG